MLKHASLFLCCVQSAMQGRTYRLDNAQKGRLPVATIVGAILAVLILALVYVKVTAEPDSWVQRNRRGS